MVKLLPCPFCGGAGVLEAVFPLDGGKFWSVHCRDCRALGPFTPANVTEKIAVELWNNRTPFTQQQLRDIRSLDGAGDYRGALLVAAQASKTSY